MLLTEILCTNEQVAEFGCHALAGADMAKERRRLLHERDVNAKETQLLVAANEQRSKLQQRLLAKRRAKTEGSHPQGAES